MAKQFLTKSRFKVGCECPTKLSYLDDKSYGSTLKENSLLEALAEGGFQVGELSKIYNPGGIEVSTSDKDQAIAETNELLKLDRVIIFEAAFRFERLFIRADIVIKSGNSIQLFEVKAKSFDRSIEDPFFTKTSVKKGNPQLNSEWDPYIVDVAFQKYVVLKAHPKINVTASLMLADKNATASVDGLNQRFFIDSNPGRKTKIKVVADTTVATVGDPLLTKVNVDAEVDVAWAMTFDEQFSFEQMLDRLSDICENGKFVEPMVGAKCKGCEFRIPSEDKRLGSKSGFDRCWQEVARKNRFEVNDPLVFDIWNFRRADKLIQNGVYTIRSVVEEDIAPSSKKNEVGLSTSERQWLQVEKIQTEESSPYIDYSGLEREMQSWNFPLHFIDFETTMVAIPFHKGRKPYEQIAFQFSHHQVEKDGAVSHKTEYLNTVKGKFPNFDFVRCLKTALSKDQGTIFRYAAHENTVLVQIRDQISQSEEVDREELVEFIETITDSTDSSSSQWQGSRSMIDMCDLVKRYFYHPATKGSNSIKKVLPAILNDSKHLKIKYSKPIYGTTTGPSSKNFKAWSWIETDPSGNVVDPYKRLPPIFSDMDLSEMDSLILDGSISDGGAAMTSYARMQFTEMSPAESKRVAEALLKYCELDTFAMVLIYEYWRTEIEDAKRSGRAAS